LTTYTKKLASRGARVVGRNPFWDGSRVQWIQTERGRLDEVATSNPNEIDRIASSSATTFCVVCGPSSGICVLDVEGPFHDGVPEDNLDRFWEWAGKHIEVNTLFVRTKGGGCHVWFWISPLQRLPHTDEIDGIRMEVFADDGKTVPLPGTTISMNGRGELEYRVTLNHETAAMPEQLSEYLTTTISKSSASSVAIVVDEKVPNGTTGRRLLRSN